MYKIDVSNANPVLPTPAAPGPNPDSYFQSSLVPCQVTHDFLNAVQEEVCNVILMSGAGLTLSKTDRTQLYQAISYMVSSSSGGFITAVVQDTDPHLGGNLNVNSFGIVSSTSTLNISSPTKIVISPIMAVQSDLVCAGDTTTKINFSSNTQSFYVGGSLVATLNASGLMLASGARISNILNDSSLTDDSDTELATQQAIVAYANKIATTYLQGCLYGFWEGTINNTAYCWNIGNGYCQAEWPTSSSPTDPDMHQLVTNSLQAALYPTPPDGYGQSLINCNFDIWIDAAPGVGKTFIIYAANGASAYNPTPGSTLITISGTDTSGSYSGYYPNALFFGAGTGSPTMPTRIVYRISGAIFER